MFHNTPLVMVETTEALAPVAERLQNARVIGIDTESNSFYAYQERVCLLQITDEIGDIIVDPLKVKDMSALGPAMADPSIVKVLHGADYDVVSLKRDFGWQFENLFDTLLAAQFLGLPKFGLGDLITRFFGWEIDKAYQRYDWTLRPLLPQHIDYARGDTHFLLALREIMTSRLKKTGRYSHFVEECGLLARREWTGKTQDPADFLRVKLSQDLNDDELRVLRQLYRYREEQGRAQDRPVFKIIPDDVLVMLAQRQPQTEDELERDLPGKGNLKRRYGRGLVDAILVGIEDAEPIPTKLKPDRNRSRGPRTRLKGRNAERALNDLKAWRNNLTDTDNTLSAHNTVSNTILKTIAATRPRSLDELRDINDVRVWQVEMFGDQILTVLDQADADD